MTYTIKSLMRLAQEYDDELYSLVDGRSDEQKVSISAMCVGSFINWLHEKNKTVVKTSE